jgi:superfamily II DNA/RNA helicase
MEYNDLNKSLFKAFGYIEPSEIQKKVMENLGGMNSLIIIAQAGSGKTFSYLLYLLNKFDFELKKPQAVVILPTRELAVQTSQYLDKFNESVGGICYQLIVGGYSRKEVKLSGDTQIVIGTIGKLSKIMSAKNLDLKALRLIVIDEADKVAFQNKNKVLEKLLNRFYKNKKEGEINMILVSASYSKDAHNFYNRYIKDYKVLKAEGEEKEIKPDELGILNNIIEFYHTFKLDKKKTYFEQKYEALYSVLQNTTFKQCLIFYNQKGKGEELASDLRDNGWSTTFIHGDLDQDQRILIYEKIKSLKVKLVISTDLVSLCI